MRRRADLSSSWGLVVVVASANMLKALNAYHYSLMSPLTRSSVLCLVPSIIRPNQVAVDAFATVLNTHKWVALSSAAPRARRGAPPTPPPDPAEAARGEAAPPYALMDHAPLATLTNGLLGAMNELRHCAPLALAAPCAQTLQVSALSLVLSSHACSLPDA